MARSGRKPKEGKRHPGGQLMHVSKVDLGTPERLLHKGGMVVETFSEMRGRSTVERKRMRSVADCMLDELYIAGKLGKLDLRVTKPRYDAGMWLRELYVKLHPGSSAMEPDVVRGSGEMSDRAAWNTKVYHDVMRALGPFQQTVFAVCCEDRRDVSIIILNLGLDKLARHRGFL